MKQVNAVDVHAGDRLIIDSHSYLVHRKRSETGPGFKRIELGVYHSQHRGCEGPGGNTAVIDYDHTDVVVVEA